jgi:hypothetical protein
MYTQAGKPTPSATATDSTGLALVFNQPVGTTSYTGTCSAGAMHSYTAVLNAGTPTNPYWITHVVIQP